MYWKVEFIIYFELISVTAVLHSILLNAYFKCKWVVDYLDLCELKTQQLNFSDIYSVRIFGSKSSVTIIK